MFVYYFTQTNTCLQGGFATAARIRVAAGPTKALGNDSDVGQTEHGNTGGGEILFVPLGVKSTEDTACEVKIRSIGGTWNVPGQRSGVWSYVIPLLGETQARLA
jgi:hypothetical protein